MRSLFHILKVARIKCFILLVLAFAWIWGAVIEPYFMLETTHVTIKARNWSDKFSTLKIVLVGDFHAGAGPFEVWRIKKAVDAINAENPDIVIFLGDFFNGRFYQTRMDIETFANILSKVRAKYGKYSILGNHDVYCGVNKIRDLLSMADIRLLVNSNDKINTPYGDIYIAGIADPVTSSYAYKPTLSGIPDGAPIIFLSHSPGVMREIPDRVSVTFSGHTHGGQICLPFYGAITSNCALPRRYASGLAELYGKVLYTNRGLGTSRIPLRFFCPPEITVVRLESDSLTKGGINDSNIGAGLKNSKKSATKITKKDSITN